MSVSLTILRTLDGHKIPISLEEFMAAAAALGGWETDARKRLASTAMPQGGYLTVRWAEGEVWADVTAYEAAPAALLPLADALRARLRDEDFMTYSSVHEIYRHADDELEASKAARRSALPIAPRAHFSRILKLAILVALASVAVASWWSGRRP
jgi:hypothetical protein